MDRPSLAHALLLADPSPSLRYLVLRELLGRPERDGELQELGRQRLQEPALATLLGSESALEGGPGRTETMPLAVALIRLGFHGFDRTHGAVASRAERLFSLQRADGSWPLPRSSELAAAGAHDMVPLQTAIPLRGLAMCGYAEDPRAEKAYDWLSGKLLSDGAWPTGFASGVYRRVGGYRRLSHSRWGCRSNTTGALLCLACHPRRAASEEARRGLDHLLARETRDRAALGAEVARLVGAEPYRGFLTFYAAFDAALLLHLCARIGASREDERVRGLLEFVTGLRGPAALWEHPHSKTASRWLTFDLERSIRRIGETSEWLSLGPRTHFVAYPRRPRRA